MNKYEKVLFEWKSLRQRLATFAEIVIFIVIYFANVCVAGKFIARNAFLLCLEVKLRKCCDLYVNAKLKCR